jgi:hypothetical protein
MIGARLVAFALLVCAAFAWSVPWLDRPGTAVLGLAFAALTVGRVAVAARPTLPIARGPALFDGRGLEPVTRDLADELRAYSMGNVGGSDAA